MEVTHLVAKLRARVAADGLRATARSLGLSDIYLRDVLSGRRKPGPKLRAAWSRIKQRED